MSSDSRLAAFAQAAKRAESVSGCLVASLVAAWRRAFQQPIEDALQCSPEDVVQLSLCLRPRGEHGPLTSGRLPRPSGLRGLV